MIIADTKNADLQIFKSDFNLSKSSHGVKSKLRKKSVINHFPRLKSKLVYKVIFFYFIIYFLPGSTFLLQD